jgi:hypothetical protein
MMILDGLNAVIARGSTAALPTAVGMTDFGSCMVKLWSCWGRRVMRAGLVECQRWCLPGLCPALKQECL